LNVRSLAMLQTPGRQPMRLAAIARSGASVNSGPGQPLRVGDRLFTSRCGQPMHPIADIQKDDYFSAQCQLPA